MNDFAIRYSRDGQDHFITPANYDLANQVVTALKTDPSVEDVSFMVNWVRPVNDVREEGVTKDKPDDPEYEPNWDFSQS